ncbi:unnamed protein product, partial [Phaeothamnion confervicola]
TLTFTASSHAVNTGGGTVVKACATAPEATSYLRSESVQTISLDDILREHPHIRYLKIDAEGAEYPILFTSTLLARVYEISGEFHETQAEPRHTMAALAKHLTAQGFWVAWKQTSPGLGLFFASRDSD